MCLFNFHPCYQNSHLPPGYINPFTAKVPVVLLGHQPGKLNIPVWTVKLLQPPESRDVHLLKNLNRVFSCALAALAL